MDQGHLPDAVNQPDGRREPFEPERITRTLFAASERIGRPDPFLARELTDGVLHFLAHEIDSNTTTTEEIAGIVVKVVRELGHPDLAAAFERRATGVIRERRAAPPSMFPARPVEMQIAWSLDNVFPRELVAAHREGLIHLNGLDAPLQMEGVSAVLMSGAIREQLRIARETAGQFVSVDGPEFDLATLPGEPELLATEFIREAEAAARDFKLGLILTLNVAEPPPRHSRGVGPLFAGQPTHDDNRRAQIARALAENATGPWVSIWWHVRSRPVNPDAWFPSIVAGRSLEFVFDRPRLPIALAPGIDRQVPATLIRVGVNIARMVELMGGRPVNPGVYLQKVASLTRFAKTAAHVKQDFLRRHGVPAIRAAFLLDRARLVLEPIGLVDAARSSERPAVEFARDILKTMRHAAESDRPRTIPVQIDCGLGDSQAIAVADVDTPVEQQIKLASTLHTTMGAGRLDVAGTLPLATIRLAAEANVSRLRVASL